MVLCFDTGGIVFAIIAGLADNVAGNFFMATLIIALLLLSLCAMFGIPIEYTSIILLPLHLAFLACLGTSWLGITGTILIYLGILLGKNFFFR